MTRTLLSVVVFLAGLAVVGWIGASYLGTNLLALAIILLIGVVYLTGALELRRYQQGTDRLARAVAGLTGAPSSLDSWLSQLPPDLRGATRLRIEGQRVGLPGPTLTPYLVGMLVLLGMLGTFLGMVATLRGTGVALESAVDLQAIRASLAAPVQGLGFAFGTSVAGVATSAALGLLATLCRRARVQAAQQLDVMIATTLRPYSQNHQGEQTYKLMQRQAEALPLLVERLQTMMAAMEQQSQALHERLAASQDAFYQRTEAAYTGLASSLEQSLKQSVVDSSRMAAEAVQPAVQTTLAGLARETSAWQDTLAGAIRLQMEGLSGRFEATTASVADIWHQALAQQQQANSTLADSNQRALTAATASLEQHASALLHNMNQSHETLQNKLAEQDQQRLDNWKASLDQLAAGVQTSLDQTTSTLQTSFAGIAASLESSLQDTTSSLRTSLHDTTSLLNSSLQDTTSSLNASLNETTSSLNSSLQDTTSSLNASLKETTSSLNASLKDTTSSMNALLQDTSASLNTALQDTSTSLNTALHGTVSSLSASLQDTAATMHQQWQQTSAEAAERQQAICDTLAQTAQELTAQTQAHARDTITEVSQLLHTVSEAPKAAAEVITELRQSHVDLQAQLIAQDQQRLENWKGTLDHIASNWNGSLETTATALSQSLESTTGTLSRSLDATAQTLHSALEKTTSALNTSMQDTSATLRQEWQQASTHAAERQQAICDTLAQTAQELTTQTQAQARDTISEVSQLLDTVAQAPKAAAEVIAELRQSHADLQAQLIAQDQQRLENWKGTLDHIASNWNASLETTATALNQSLEKTTGALSASMEDTAASLGASLTGTTSTLTVTLENTASTLHNSFDDISSALNVSMENTAYTLRQEWEQMSAQAAERHQVLCETLRETAQQLATQTQTQARDTIDEVAQLVQAAAEAPRAAASVIAELRQKLSDGMARDNEMLEERNRLMDTLSTLLDAVNHASTQQRDTVDALISHSSELLERVGSRFSDTAQSETVKLTDAAATITGSAVEVASLGEAFGAAVQCFSQSNDKLVEHLARIETALEKSMTRSDEQLAYYVAQAREVVDLSVMSQKQIIEDLQLLAAQQTAPKSEADA